MGEKRSTRRREPQEASGCSYDRALYLPPTGRRCDACRPLPDPIVRWSFQARPSRDSHDPRLPGSPRSRAVQAATGGHKSRWLDYWPCSSRSPCWSADMTLPGPLYHSIWSILSLVSSHPRAGSGRDAGDRNRDAVLRQQP